MQSVSSRIWTRVAVFISYDDNNYTTGTSAKIKIEMMINQLSIIFFKIETVFKKCQDWLCIYQSSNEEWNFRCLQNT